jgi:hypothetical protein
MALGEQEKSEKGGTEELETAVENLKSGKVAGPGNIPAHLLKNVPQKLYKMIAQVFTVCINK